MQAGKLRQALEAVIFAASPNAYSHPTLSGVNFEFDAAKLTLAAADGFRLARRVVDLELAAVAEPFSALVPAQTLRELRYLLKDVADREDDEVLFYVNDAHTQAQFLCGSDLLLTTQLIDGNFPAYQRIIPDLNAYPVTVTVSRSQLLQAVKRARIFSDMLVRFTCRSDLDAETLTVEAEGAEAGNGETELGVDLAMPEDVFSISFNPKFFIQLLQAINTEQVTLAFKNANRPGVVYPAAGTWQTHIHVIMPMAL
jgi:DNA polymerase-3 subunit beta